MKHRQPRRADWRKKPAKRKIKLWQRPEFNIDTHVTNGNFKMYINDVYQWCGIFVVNDEVIGEPRGKHYCGG